MRGADRLRARLREIARKTGPAIEKAVLQGAEEIAVKARSRAPRDDGDLIASIGAGLGDAPPASMTSGGRAKKMAARDERSLIRASVWAGDDKAFYARLVEFGTAPHPQGGQLAGTDHPGTPPRGFFYPSFREGRKKATARVARAINKSIKDALK